MRNRCQNPKNREYVRYGARGILVCDEWKVFTVFQKWCLENFEPGKTLDRINNDGPYSPENCRWATATQQQITARRTQAKRDAIKYAVSLRDKDFWKHRERNAKGHFKGSL